MRVRVYNSIAAYRHLSNFEMAIGYAQQALKLSLKLGYAKGEAMAYQNKALAYWAHAVYDSALFYHSKALDIFLENNLEDDFGEAYNGIGLVYYYTANYPKALEYLNKAEAQFRKLNDTTNLSRILNNLGLIYDSRGEYLRSENYFIEAMKLDLNFRNVYEQSSKRYGQQASEDNTFVKKRLLQRKLNELESFSQKEPSLALVSRYYEIANLFELLGEDEKAIEYFHKSEYVYGALDEKLLLADCYRKLAEIERRRSNNDVSRDYLTQAYQIFLENGYSIQLDYVLNDLADVESAHGNFRKAIDYLNACILLDDSVGHRLSVITTKTKLSGLYLSVGNIPLAISTAGDAYDAASYLEIKKSQRNAAKALYKAYVQGKDFERALFFLEEATTIEQKIDNALSHREIAKLKIGYETEEKQKEIDQLHQIATLNSSVLTLQKQMIILLSAGLIAIIILLMFVNTRLKKIRALNSSIDAQKTQIADQNKRLEKRAREREILIGEIHHRVKNNLQIISSLLRLQQRGIEDVNARKAIFEGQNRVQSMSLLHQRLYQQGNHESVEMKQYAEDIFDHLLRVHHLGESQVSRVNSCDEIDLDVDTAVTFGLIINEVFSNIFKHAYQPGKKLTVKCEGTSAGNQVLVRISDNGPGFDLEFESSQAHFGLNLMKMLVSEMDGTVLFSNTEDGGAEVEIKFRMA
ncbi:tetratricopeptide repeat protein [Imperialibacter roseus]|uniref:Tetratricopeptide repeat protein n=1 Tax=Imperialibacter roseus TaxID=1324217 RepID=A0ABZ0IPG3_9BACT|nr:tetratricopeptide repeat protein [Imperialibacter roseus]WOK06874.1 tetratricopeptide repeat protein [Imperialibacter roseus]